MELHEARNEVFRRIGRNLFNYQSTEALLKVLVRRAGIRVSVGARSDDWFGIFLKRWDRHAARTTTRTMGDLVEQFLGNAIFNEGDDTSTPDFDRRTLVGISVKTGLHSTEIEKLNSDLRVVVEDRNFLAHGLLEEWSQKSLDSTRSLLIELDLQLERLHPVYELLRRIAESTDAQVASAINVIDLEEGLIPPGGDRLIDMDICRLLVGIAGNKKDPKGWVLLASAANLVRDTYPARLEKPDAYLGYGSLKKLMLATGLFEFREPSAESGTEAYFRLKSPA